jgi:3-dehydroquinate synthase
MRAGYAEILKYGLLGDEYFFAWLEANGGAVLSRDSEALARAVERSVEMKAEIVIADEREAGRRALLNLGHTFGHALEAETGYGETLLHGEAVALGSAMAFRYSAAEGLCPAADAERAVAAVAAAGLPARLSDLGARTFAADDLLRHMAQDKKAEGGRLTFILARRAGEAFVARDVDADRMRAFLVSEGAV